MKKTMKKRPLTLLLTLCLALQLCVPAAAYRGDMTAGEAALALIEEGEGFRAYAYEDSGRWYIGYGTQCDEDEYPDGITREEAEELLRDKIEGYEEKLNDFFYRYDVEPTQGQFDALISFSYNFGTGWMSGTSDLVKIARGEIEATRLEVAQAFGEWCHSGGQAMRGLAERRLQEAALFLDGDTWAAEYEFAYFIIYQENGITYETDFRVYEIGETYDSFPTAEKVGYRLAGFETGDGDLLTEDSRVRESVVVTPVWEESRYTGKTYPDVTKKDWFYDYVMELSEKGIIGGNDDGTYAPNRSTSTGETLKLVLLAAGHKEQSPTSKHWASGYAHYALSMSFLASEYTAQQLDQPISRLAVARFAAKALGYGASNAESPFADVDDGYVTALYEAGVFGGTEVGDVTYFYPNSSIRRSEIAAVIYRIYRLSERNEGQKIYYKDYTLNVLPNVPTNDYDKTAFERDGSFLYYNDSSVRTRIGIDVSQYQGSIDWDEVARSGIDFAIVRVGGRGYTEGKIYDDTMFEVNAKGASDAGLITGAYFFSQAITPREAAEEAYYVLDKLEGLTIDGPVVFDWEVIGKSDARTYGIQTDDLCACALTFCEIIEAAGYDAMIYITDYSGYVKYDLSEVVDYPLWYANYSTETPNFYYDFDMWQYSSKGSVPGISGNVDMDIWFYRK